MLNKFNTTATMPTMSSEGTSDKSGKLVNLLIMGGIAYALWRFVIKPEIDKANYIKLQDKNKE